MNNIYRELNININDIVNDNHFKVSKNIYPPELEFSIQTYGMIEKPVVFLADNKYQPLTCHNRIKILKKIGADSVLTLIADAPDYNLFYNNLVLKIYRNEVGPIGRLRAFEILKNDFKIEETVLQDVSKRILRIPGELSGNSALISSILNLPDQLKDYIDSKDINFKIIRDIICFKDDIISEFYRWLLKIQVRHNIFKMLVDYVFDISKRDGGLMSIPDELLSTMDDKRLYEHVFRIRYPEYSGKKDRSDTVIRSITRNGVSIDFPEYYERVDFTIKLTVNKKDNTNKIKEITSSIDIKKIEELQSLL